MGIPLTPVPICTPFEVLVLSIVQDVVALTSTVAVAKSISPSATRLRMVSPELYIYIASSRNLNWFDDSSLKADVDSLTAEELLAPAPSSVNMDFSEAVKPAWSAADPTPNNCL